MSSLADEEAIFEAWLRDMQERSKRDAGIKDRGGVSWHEAPLPPRWHRCSGSSVRRDALGMLNFERCACGASRIDGCGWIERNSRRKGAGVWGWVYLGLVAMPCVILLIRWLTGSPITFGLVVAIFALPMGTATGLAFVDVLGWREKRRATERRDAGPAGKESD